MRSIIGWSLKNKSVVILAAVLLIASGAYATTRLNQELLPNIEFPTVAVATPVPGAGPELVDEQVTQPIESALGNVQGIDSTQSTSSQGFSVVLVQLSLDTDARQAEDEIRRSLDGVSLPSEASQPEVNRQSSTSFPIMNISLAAKDGNLVDLTNYAQDKVVPLLEDVPGTANVDLVGGAQKEIQVSLDPKKLKEKNIPAEAVVGAISGADVNAPVGDVRIDGLATPVRAESRLTDVDALKNLPIGAGAASVGTPGGASQGGPPGGASGGGSPEGASSGSAPPSGAPQASGQSPEPVLLKDVATVKKVESNISGISRTNGEPSLGLNVVKDSNANTIDVANGVEEALGQVRGRIGNDQVRIINNSADDVKESISGLIEKALIGAAVAVFIILLFLRSIRATLVTAVSLPTSVLAALLFSWGDNLTLNIITLAGLTIAIGRVVDDAIVVLENSYRYVQEGYEPEAAAFKGTTEVASAITSSTLSTAAVFLPLGLVGGIISKFFLPLSLTVAFALAASLIVAVTIIPVLVSLFLKRTAGNEDAPAVRRTSRRNSGRRWVPRLLIGVAVLLFSAVAAVAIAGLTGAIVGILFGPETSIIILAVLAATLVAGFVAFFLLRSRGSRDDEPLDEADETISGGRDPEKRSEGRLVGIYTPALRWSLRNRAVVLALAVFVFAGGLGIVTLLPVSFFPPSEARLLVADVALPTGTYLQKTSDELKPFEKAMRNDEGVESYQLSIGGQNNFDPSGNRSDNTAQAFVTVKKSASVDGVVNRLQKEGRDLYGRGDFQIQVQNQGPASGGLEVRLTDGSEKELKQASDKVVGKLSNNDDLTNVQSDITGGAPEVNVALDAQKAAKAGLSPGGVAQTLGVLLSDRSQLSIGDTPVSVGLPTGSVDTLKQVRDLPTGPGATVGDVAEVSQVAAPTAISRVDGQRAVTVTGTITSENSNAVSGQVASSLDKLDLPGGVKASVGGESRRTSRRASGSCSSLSWSPSLWFT